MTAFEHVTDGPRGVPEELRTGASPKVIVGYLFDEDRERFRDQYEAALDEARRSYELGGVQKVVEHWRRIAALQSDPEGFREAVRVLAECETGETTPPGESFATTRRRAGM